MIKMMDKVEKREYVYNLDRVKSRKEEVWVGGLNGHYSKTAMGTIEGEAKYYMKFDYVVIDDHVIRLDKYDIDSTVYYDDETPDPLRSDSEDVRKDVWMAYNLRNYTWREDIENAAQYSHYIDEHTVEHGWYTGKNAPFLFKNCDGTSFIVWNAKYYNGADRRYPEKDRRYLTPEELDQLM